MSLNSKVAIWTAMIAAVATIGAAFMGVVPNLVGKKSYYTISGHVKAKSNNAPVTNAMFFASRADDSVSLDDEGAFNLPHMANQRYYIVMQTQDGKTTRVLINPTEAETELPTDQFVITYNFSKE